MTIKRKALANALGYLRVMFTVEDIDDTVARLCYIRGPEGILIGLAQELRKQI